MRKSSKILTVMLAGFVLFQIGETIVRPVAGIAWLIMDAIAFTFGGVLTLLAWTTDRFSHERFKRHLKKTVGWDWID